MNDKDEIARLRALLAYHRIDPDEPVPTPYDRTFGDDRLCKCGHPYYRHFDTYEDMRPVGCKYCGPDCEGFVEGESR